MNIDTGEIKSFLEVSNLPEEEQKRYVEIAGSRENIYFVSQAVKEKRRRMGKAARKARRLNRGK